MRGRKKPNPVQEATANIDLSDASPFLVLGKRKSSGTVWARKYQIVDAIAERLREVAVAALVHANSEETSMSLYDGYATIGPEEGIWVNNEHVRGEAPILQALATVDDVEELNADEVASERLSFYAIGFGPDHKRIFFVRQRASHILTSSKILGLIGKKLSPVKQSILSLDTYVDFIVMDEGMVVFDGVAFEKYIQEPEDIARHVDSTLQKLSKQVPITSSALELLTKSGTSSLFVRGRLRSIISKPYFANLSIAAVQATIEEKGLDPARFIANGELNFPKEEAVFVLKLLDQKVWQGDFDGQLYSTSSANQEER